MAVLDCSVSDGPRPGYKNVVVRSSQNSTEQFSIEERFLKLVSNGIYKLPVRVIEIIRKEELFLVQLPVEADSGANRVFVPKRSLTFSPEEAPI